MIYRKETQNGVVSIDNAVLSQLLTEAIRPWQGKIKVQTDKTAKILSGGIYIDLTFSVLIGESITAIAQSVIDFLASAFSNSLEMETDDIVIRIDSVYTKKGNHSKRNMKFTYKERKNASKNQ